MSAKIKKSTELHRERQRKYRKKKKLDEQSSSHSDQEQDCSSTQPAHEDSPGYDPSLENSSHASFTLDNSSIPINAVHNKNREAANLNRSISSNASSTEGRIHEVSSESESTDNSTYCEPDSENSQDQPPLQNNLRQKIREWASRDISQAKIDELLKILHEYHPELPLSSKTLLKSDLRLRELIRRFNESDPSGESEFVYFGIARYLLQMVNPSLHPDGIIRLIFNVDGMSPYKSSSINVWAHMGKVDHEQTNLYQAFIIAAHCGIGKPSSVDLYLENFIEELNGLCEEGIVIEDVKFRVEVKCFGCDRPARAYIKCIVNRGGYYACERCCVEGIDHDNRRVYPFRNEEQRTDESFKLQSNPQHHRGVSPLVKLKRPINLVVLFLLEIMHLLCLGNMKKLLKRWFSGNSKLTREMMVKVSLRLVNLSKQIPVDFQRSARSLSDISKWTANEFRLFLLYTGPFVLKDILDEELYDHFMLLYVACRILCRQNLFKKYTPCAKEYLQRFVLLCEELYGLEFVTLYVHSLVHHHEDVEYMGRSLSDLTAFPFENLLGILERFIRSGFKPLVRICKMVERDIEFKFHKVTQPPEMEILKSKQQDNLFHIQKLRIRNFELTCEKPNNTIFLKDGSLFRIKDLTCSSLTKDTSKVLAVGTKVEMLGLAFEYPITSSLLQVYSVKEESSGTEILQIPLSDMQCKAMLLEIYELPSDSKELYAMPLLHQYLIIMCILSMRLTKIKTSVT